MGAGYNREVLSPPLGLDCVGARYNRKVLGHQQMYDLERFYGTKVGFYKGTDSYKLYKLAIFPCFLCPTFDEVAC